MLFAELQKLFLQRFLFIIININYYMVGKITSIRIYVIIINTKNIYFDRESTNH